MVSQALFGVLDLEREGQIPEAGVDGWDFFFF